MAEVSPQMSEYFSNLAKKRKKVPFRDPAVARAAQLKSVEARKRNLKKAADEQNNI